MPFFAFPKFYVFLSISLFAKPFSLGRSRGARKPQRWYFEHFGTYFETQERVQESSAEAFTLVKMHRSATSKKERQRTSQTVAKFMFADYTIFTILNGIFDFLGMHFGDILEESVLPLTRNPSFFGKHASRAGQTPTFQHLKN